MMFSPDSLRQYRRDIAEHVPRFPEGENPQDLVESHLPLAIRVAWYYQRYGADLMDLIQEGNLGLLRAAQRFDPTQGVQFETYAIYWVRQAILSSLLPQRQMLSVPVYKLEQVQKLLHTQRQMREAAGHEPTLEELAQRMEVSVASVLELFALQQMCAVSIHAPTGDHEDDMLADVLEAPPEHTPEHVALLQSRNEQIQDLLAVLTKDEREVVLLRYGLRDGVEHSYEEIMRSTLLGDRRVHTLEQRAMLKMRRLAVLRQLQDFVG